MNTSEIELKVRQIIAKKFDADLNTLTPETNLATDLGVDSFGAVELMFEIEEAFGLKIPDSEIEHIRTIKHIVEYVDVWSKKNQPT